MTARLSYHKYLDIKKNSVLRKRRRIRIRIRIRRTKGRIS